MHFFSSIFGSSKDEDTPTPSTHDTSEPSSPTPSPPISDSGQKNVVSEYPMVNHPVAQEHFDGVRSTVIENFEDEDVRRLSDSMGEYRQGWSDKHADKSDKDAIHEIQAADSGKQLDAVMSGTVSPDQVLPMVSTSFAPFVDSLTNPEKSPETLSQGGNAIMAAVTGLMSIIASEPPSSY